MLRPTHIRSRFASLTLLSSMLLSALLSAGCSGGGGGQAVLASILIPEAREIEIGRGVHEDVISQYPILEAPGVTAYIDALGQELVVKSLRPDLAHTFYVLDTEQINAFAAPGGFVYVTVGLLRNIQSRAELAGVIGHEIGHVSGRHGIRTMQAALLTDLISSWLLGDDSAAKQVIAWAANFYQTTAHSRDLEREADEYGVTFALDTGYNPWGLVEFFGFLEGLSPSIPIADFLSSHPAPSERIENTTAQIQGLGITKDDPSLIIENANPPYMSVGDLKALLPPAPAAPAVTADGQ